MFGLKRREWRTRIVQADLICQFADNLQALALGSPVEP